MSLTVARTTADGSPTSLPGRSTRHISTIAHPLQPPPNAAALTHTDADRSAFPTTVAAQWAQLGPRNYPFAHKAATKPPQHDDRGKFRTGP